MNMFQQAIPHQGFLEQIQAAGEQYAVSGKKKYHSEGAKQVTDKKQSPF
jgi:hypothetical protein